MSSAAIAAGRAAAERQMSDTLAFGTLTRGDQLPDGTEPPVYTAVFTTPGKVRGTAADSDPQVRMVDVGGVQRPVVSGGVSIPSRVTDAVSPGMYVWVTALGESSPPALADRRWRVEGESVESWQTARRFDVVEVP